MKSILSVLFFTLFGIINYQLTEALQCYVCENCVDGTDLKEMQICGELPVELTTQETTIEPSTQRTRTTASRRSTVTTRRSTSTTRRTTTEVESESEEEYSDYEDSNEDERKRNLNLKNLKLHDEHIGYIMHPMQQLINEPRPVCYIVKYNVNNTQTTSLGCTSMIQNNIFLTCQSLYRANATMDDCQLCSKNGCNKIFLSGNDTDNEWDFPWQSGTNKIDLNIINLLLMLSLIKLFN